MNNDPKESLAAALARSGPAAALTALRSAIAWAADSLSDVSASGDDLAALQAVIALGDAMADLERLFGLVPALVEIASPGRSVEQRMAAHQSTLNRLRTELDADRSALKAAGDVEKRLAQAQAQHDEMRAQIAILELQRAVAGQLPALEATLGSLREAIDEATARQAEQVAQGLVTAVRRLADLTQEQRGLIGGDLARLAEDVVTSGEALAAETARLDELRAEEAARLSEAQEIRREHEEALPALELHRRADEALTEGLAAGCPPSDESALERVRGSLADIGQHLADLDTALKPLLEQHASAYTEARRIRNWSN